MAKIHQPYLDITVYFGENFITGLRPNRIKISFILKENGHPTQNFIDIINIFSGGERQIVTENFKGGKITSIFGGSEIDLTQAKLAPGVSELEIACIFGGTTIIVPTDWNIKVEVVPVLGGFGDERKLNLGRAVDTSRQLIIKGAVVFGGGEIKSYS